MANFTERAKDWWESKAPREQRLLAILGATLVVCIIGWVAMTIRGGRVAAAPAVSPIFRQTSAAIAL